MLLYFAQPHNMLIINASTYHLTVFYLPDIPYHFINPHINCHQCHSKPDPTSLTYGSATTIYGELPALLTPTLFRSRVFFG